MAITKATNKANKERGAGAAVPPHGGARRGAGRPPKDGKKTSIYVSTEAGELWAATAKKLGIQKTPVLELALREFATKHGVKITQTNRE